MGKSYLGTCFASALFSKKAKSKSKSGATVALLSATILSSTGLLANNTASAAAFDPIMSDILRGQYNDDKKDTASKNENKKSGIIWSCLSSVGSTIMNTINTAGKIAAPFYTIGGALGQIQNVYNAYCSYKDFVEDKVITKFIPKDDPFKGLTAFEAREKAQKLMDRNFFGQKDAKEAIDDALPYIVEHHGERPNIFYLLGPSGCGKNVLTEKVLTPILCGANTKPLVLGADFFDTEDTKDAVSVKEQLVGFRKFGDHMVPSPILTYIVKNPNGCIVFNELDKGKDKNGVSIITKIEEVLRTILDDGKITLPDGTELDCRGLTFCFTTNELRECIENVNNFGDIDLTKVKDPSGSRTVVKHDKSFLNRPNIFVIPFDALSAKDYKQIADKEYKELAIKIQEKYGAHILYEDNLKELCSSIATEAIKLNKGGRSITPIIRKINIKILNYIKQLIDEAKSQGPLLLDKLRRGDVNITRHENNILRVYSRISRNIYGDFRIDLEVNYDSEKGDFVISDHEHRRTRNSDNGSLGTPDDTSKPNHEKEKLEEAQPDASAAPTAEKPNDKSNIGDGAKLPTAPAANKPNDAPVPKSSQTSNADDIQNASTSGELSRDSNKVEAKSSPSADNIVDKPIVSENSGAAKPALPHFKN